MENYDFVKYLYGGGDKFYLETVSKFRLKKGEIIYMGERFDSSKMI